MEIPLVARISEFAAVSSSNVIHHGYWKWGALILALIYAFNRVSCVVIKVFILQLHRKTAEFSSSSALVIAGDDSDDFCSSDDEEGDSDDSACSSEDEKEMCDDPASISYDNLAGFCEDFVVKGSGNSDERSARKRKFKMRRKRSLGGNMFSLGDLVNGSSVVKIWDGLGLGLGLGLDGSNSTVSIFDLERSFKIGSFPGQIPAVSASSSAVVFTASAGCDGTLGLRSWDVRVRRRSAAAKAEWPITPPESGLRVKAGGVEKVYVRDDGSRKGKVWDMRNSKSPLENVTEYDGEKWWDANAVSQTEEE